VYRKRGIRDSYPVLLGLGLLFCISVDAFYFIDVTIRKHSSFPSEPALEKEKREQENNIYDVSDDMFVAPVPGEV
jgi:hypothetical protein